MPTPPKLNASQVLEAVFDEENELLRTSAEITLTNNDVQIVDSDGDPLIDQKAMTGSLPVVIANNQSAIPITNTVLADISDGTAHAAKTKEVDAAGDNFIGQKTMAASKPVVIASDQSAIPVSNSVLTSLLNQIINYLPVKQIETWTISGIITSITNTVTIAGAVTNAVLTDVYSAASHYLRVNIENASIAVTGTFWQATQPVSGSLTTVSTVNTVTNDVGVKGLKALGDGVNFLLDAQPKAIAVPAGAETVNLYNTHATAVMYPGVSASQGAAGIPISSEELLLNYPVTGLTSVYVYPTVSPSTVGYQFYGRS